MSKDLVQCGVIGAGWWATTHHIPALKEHPKAELIAVQRRTREKADKVAQDFDIPHACTTAEELVGIDELDAVVISSTPNMHYAQAKAALDRGLHVLIEKCVSLFVCSQWKSLLKDRSHYANHYSREVNFHMLSYGDVPYLRLRF